MIARFIFSIVLLQHISFGVPTEMPRKGSLDGVTLWNLPETDNGMLPTQSWHSTGNSPEGDIYVAGMDHYTNSALYRLYGDTLRYVGDAQTASEAVNNWTTEDYAEKFHTRPTHHNGHIYVATLDRSSIDGSFYETRGFHWYAFNPADNSFVDHGDGIIEILMTFHDAGEWEVHIKMQQDLNFVKLGHITIGNNP